MERGVRRPVGAPSFGGSAGVGQDWAGHVGGQRATDLGCPEKETPLRQRPARGIAANPVPIVRAIHGSARHAFAGRLARRGAIDHLGQRAHEPALPTIDKHGHVVNNVEVSKLGGSEDKNEVAVAGIRHRWAAADCEQIEVETEEFAESCPHSRLVP